MERAEIRLQCLRIKAEGRAQVSSGQLVEEAKILEEYVTGEVPTKVESMKAQRAPNFANPSRKDPLS